MAPPALHTEFLSVGSGVSGYLAKPSGVPGIGVVVIMEAFGLNAFVKSVCERFARAGYMALAPDVYHGDTFDYADRERAIARLNEVDDDVAMREVGAALDVLVAQGARDGRLAVIGFCMRCTGEGSRRPCPSTAAASRQRWRAASASRCSTGSTTCPHPNC